MHVGLAVAVAGPTLCRGHDGEDGPPRAPPASTTSRLVPGQVSRWNGFSAPAGTGRCLGGIAGSPPVRACTRIGVAAQGPRSRSLVVVFFWRLEVAGRPCPPKGRTGAWVSFPFLPATAPVVASAAIMHAAATRAERTTRPTARRGRPPLHRAPFFGTPKAGPGTRKPNHACPPPGQPGAAPCARSRRRRHGTGFPTPPRHTAMSCSLVVPRTCLLTDTVSPLNRVRVWYFAFHRTVTHPCCSLVRFFSPPVSFSLVARTQGRTFAPRRPAVDGDLVSNQLRAPACCRLRAHVDRLSRPGLRRPNTHAMAGVG